MKRLKTLISFTLYTLLVAFLMVGCNTPDKYKSKTENGINYKVIVIDSCEYIWYKDNITSGQTLAHKGNCKNH